MRSAAQVLRLRRKPQQHTLLWADLISSWGVFRFTGAIILSPSTISKGSKMSWPAIGSVFGTLVDEPSFSPRWKEQKGLI
jgi:hypothetical protein